MKQFLDFGEYRSASGWTLFDVMREAGAMAAIDRLVINAVQFIPQQVSCKLPIGMRSHVRRDGGGGGSRAAAQC